MKKTFATLMLLLCLFVGFAGDSTGAVNNPKNDIVCHDSAGKWDPQDKRCDPYSCGCLFHQIEEFFVDLFS